MIRFIYGNSNCNDLLQECYLTRTQILSGIEFLIHSQIFNEDDGSFYAAFFNLSIGIERFLKLALVTDYMHRHNFQKPPKNYLKGFSHNLKDLYRTSVDNFRSNGFNIPDISSETTLQLFNFLNAYSNKNRFQNLDKLTNSYTTYDLHPIHEWFNISEIYFNIYENSKRNHAKHQKQISKYSFQNNLYTNFQDFQGAPLSYNKLIQYQIIIQNARCHIINDILTTLKPIYLALDNLSLETNNGEDADLTGQLKLPYFGELFPFFYAHKNQFKTTKNWVKRYN